MDLCIGVVKENYDADHPGMVLVTIPDFASEGSDTAWLPVTAPYAGKNYGIYFLPEKDEQVVVGFLGADAAGGVVLGSLWNQKNTIPADTATQENNVRIVKTKGGHSIIIKDGDDAEVTVKTTAGHKISVSDKDKKITVSVSDGKEKIVLDEGGGAVTIDAEKTVTIKAQDIKLEGKLSAMGQSVKIESDGKLDIKGKQTTVEGSTLTLKGQNSEFTGAAVKVEASGILTLKGSMAKIN